VRVAGISACLLPVWRPVRRPGPWIFRKYVVRMLRTCTLVAPGTRDIDLLEKILLQVARYISNSFLSGMVRFLYL
jgi:hypothetical protein